jgi:cytochrome bd-I ubiquinol oxidase subunit X
MWYFSWALGVGLALSFGVLNAMWFELTAGVETTAESDAHAEPDRAQ